MPDNAQVSRFYFTALSNFALGYDRYQRIYSKRNIPSRFPSRFYFLKEADIAIGRERAQQLVKKLNLPGDDVIALETKVAPSALQENTATGIGQFIESESIDLERVYRVNGDGSLASVQLEEAYAGSMRAIRSSLPGWQELTPRSVSILPVAKGCQAACPFCFSEGSISEDQSKGKLSDNRVLTVLEYAKSRGAERAVITGGGEPGLLPLPRLCSLVRMAATSFRKVVLITNGYFLTRMNEADRRDALRDLSDAGLTILSISRHHHDPVRHSEIMKLSTECERLSASWQAIRSEVSALKLRYICVLQDSGVATSDEAEAYVRWASSQGVDEVCFKELYVSSGRESVYYSRESNTCSAQHQVPLRIVMDLAAANDWKQVAKLPWGAPIFQSTGMGHPVTVAAYTEPSVTWELRNEICRSWNLMADGACFASLEDRHSEVHVA